MSTAVFNTNRHTLQKSVGTRNPKAKLSDDMVYEIRELCASGKMKQWQIAERYCVTQATISAINIGRTWAHLPWYPKEEK